ncbi:bifunctional WD40-YVTN repeat-like-containing domain superfamily/WD40-repeat-containing domain superfamily [Babesia duncani]|uniref:Bifunctional WD40-YVTN repeat-like-containing domain superfamily/WD40-repeat-containing domain superfamily n=1 Tax=Babesia duncani TaxID=323732 RepID=A0AAD9UPX7_9APIC|nr:bifunctional WD40-YVTN repeat-like-containing domain superfamily/WD40-repeat-containing domain superfamily [Babesia duncani]
MEDTCNITANTDYQRPIQLHYISDSIVDLEISHMQCLKTQILDNEIETNDKANNLKHAKSLKDEHLFIRCPNPIVSIDLVQYDVPLDPVYSHLLGIIAGNDYEQYHLLIFTVNVSLVKNGSQILLQIKTQTIVKLMEKVHENFKWLRSSDEDPYIHAACIVNKCTIEIWKIHRDKLSNEYNMLQGNNVVSKDTCMGCWSYDIECPGYEFTCMDVNYSLDNSRMVLAAGTDEGMLVVLEFEYDGSDYILKLERKIPIFIRHINPENSPRINDVAFLPTPGTNVLSIACYNGDIVIWNLKGGSLEGEIATYTSISRPINSTVFSSDCNLLLAASNSGYFVEWGRKTTVVTISPEKYIKRSNVSQFEPVCWSIDASHIDAFLGFDDGLLLRVPLKELHSRTIKYDHITSWQWYVNLDEEANVPSQTCNTYQRDVQHKEDRVIAVIQESYKADLAKLSSLSIVESRGTKPNKLCDKKMTIGHKLTAIHWFVELNDAFKF